MPLKPAYQTENYVKKIKEITSRSVVECRFSLGAGVSEVLAVSPQLSPAGCEVTSGRVNYGGRLVCTAVFADMNGGIGRAQKGAEFTHFADDECLAPAQTAVAELSCEKCTVRRDGSSYLVTAVISARISVYGNAERTYLSEADGAVCRFEQVKMLSAITFSGESEVEDEFDAAGVEDILMHSARPVVTDCRCGAGEIRIAGEIYLSLLAVRGEELVALDRVIPYTAEILCDDAVLPRRAVCRAQLRDCALSAKVIEDRGRCLVDFSATLCFDGDFCEEHEVSAATDAFMTDGEALLKISREHTPVCTDIKVYSERVGGPCSVKSPVDYGCVFRAVISPQAECTYSADTGMLEGAVSAVLIYSREGETHSAEVALPFSVKLNGEGLAVSGIAVSGMSVRQRAEGECEAEATLRITAAALSLERCAYISELTEAEGGCERPSAVTVLFPSAGETLWSAAKRLKMEPEQVAKACGAEVQFPLKGDERIVIYRPQKN